MSFLCGCFGEPSARVSRSQQGRTSSNKVHSDSSTNRERPGSKPWDSKTQLSKQKNIIIVGPEGSGKTTLVHQLIEKKAILPPPSTLVAQYKIVLNDSPMVIFDVPGNASIEGLTTGLFAMIFVVDWGDELKRCLAMENLAHLFFTNENVRTVPLLVVVNKVDNVLGMDNNDNGNAVNHDGVAMVRVTAESARVTAETTRVTTESVRITTESARVTAESAAHMLGLSMIPHPHMSVVCCSSTIGWGIQEILLWLHGIGTHAPPGSISNVDTVQNASIVW